MINPMHIVLGLISIVFVGLCLWAAIKLREALRTMGEIVAKQSEQKEWGPPDPGNPHEDTKANRDQDPR